MGGVDLKTKLGLLTSRIRLEEKLIIKEAKSRPEIEVKMIDPRKLVFDMKEPPDIDVLLDREISQSRAYHVLELLRTEQIPVINSFDTVNICGDKVLTSAKLSSSGVPTPEIKVAFDTSSAIEAAEDLGYPVVIKPVDGSWGRLLGKINDRASAEALLEHKEHLDSHYHSVLYLQEYIEKNGKDIRAFIIDGELLGAAYRVSDHWVTNASRGGQASPCPITPELENICKEAAKAVGGGALAVDLFETPDGFSVNEINCSMEFKESMKVISEDIPARLIDYAAQLSSTRIKEEPQECLPT